MKKVKGLVASMEQLEEIEAAAAAATDPVDVPVEVEAPADTLETQMLEVEDVAEIVETLDDQVEDAIGSADELQVIADKLEASLPEGGVDEATADMAEVAVESLYRRLGVTLPSKGGKPGTPMVSLEAFKGRQSRQEATRVAMEGIKETIKNVWAKIIEAVQRAYAFVKDFIVKAFSGVAKLEKRAAAKVAEYAKIEGTPSADKIESGKLASSLALGGKFSSNNVVVGLTELVASIAVSDEIAKEAVTAFGGVGGADLIKSDEGFLKAEYEARAVSGLKAVGTGEGFDVAEGSTLYRGNELLGGKAILYTDAAPGKFEGAAALVGLAKKRFSVGDFNPKAKAFEGELTVATIADIKAIAKEVLAAAKALASSKASKDSISKAQADLLADIKSASAEVAKGDEAAAKRADAVKRAVVAGNQLFTQLGVALTGYTLNTGKNALDYADKSAALYGAKAAEPAGEPAAA